MDPRRGKKITVCFVGDRSALGNIDIVREFLSDLVDAIGMRKLSEPQCVSVPIAIENLGLDCKDDEGGISGIVLLSTSHAAIHTWPEHKYAILEIHSCREFATRIVVESIVDAFFACRAKIHVADESESLRYPFELPLPDQIAP